MKDEIFKDTDALKAFMEYEMKKLSPEEQKTVTLMNIIVTNMMATSSALRANGVDRKLVDGITACALKHTLETLSENGYKHEAETLALFAHTEAQGIETVDDLLNFIIDTVEKEEK